MWIAWWECIYVCAGAHRDQRSTYDVVLQVLTALIIEAESIAWPETDVFGYVAIYLAPGIWLSLHPHHWDYKHVPPPYVFFLTWILDIHLSFSIFRGKYLTDWAISPAIGWHSISTWLNEWRDFLLEGMAIKIILWYTFLDISRMGKFILSVRFPKSKDGYSKVLLKRT